MSKEEYQKRIEHRFDPVFYKNLTLCIKRLNIYKFLFDKIVINGVENVRKVSDKQLFYVSNHISLADFLVQGYVLGNEKLPLARFIAGENLNHFPFGIAWKKCGAISVNRNQKEWGYWRNFYEIVSKNLENNENLISYCEGGRNYQNREIGEFKEGIIRTVQKAVKKGKDIWAVPMGIKYDSRIEESVLQRVIENKEKRDLHLKRKREFIEQEKFFRAGIEHVLTTHYDRAYFWNDVKAYFFRGFSPEKGNAYLKFGEPFSIKDFLAKKESISLSEKLRQEVIGVNRNI